MPAAKPTTRPGCPNFGSGPCAKRPGWKVESLDQSGLGRSHRSSVGKAKLKRCCTETHELLGLPADYRVGLVPASDTGAVEMIMWNMLGERPVDMCYWETFGKTWYADAIKELKLPEVLEISSDEYGILPDLSKTNPKHDIVFTWNGTTAGVRVPNSEWIADDREGLTICDATSAIFGADMAPWHKLDVITYSWQKVLGGEGGHGMLILSPRAVARLESYKPPRPLPKIFRLTSGGKLIDGIFHGETINTPSMLCVEDYLDALAWSRSVGGLQAKSEHTHTPLPTHRTALPVLNLSPRHTFHVFPLFTHAHVLIPPPSPTPAGSPREDGGKLCRHGGIRRADAMDSLPLRDTPSPFEHIDNLRG